MDELVNLLKELDGSMSDLEEDLKKCEESHDQLRSLVLQNRYFDALEVKELLDSYLRHSKGGKNEVFYPCA